MDGPAFQWSNTIGRGQIGGAGMDGHFLVLVLLSLMFISIVFMGWRGAQAPFKFMLIAWCALMFTSSLTTAIDNPGGYRFRGDTMGIDVNLTYTMPSLLGGLLILASWWVLRDTVRPTTRTVPKWISINSKFLIPVLVLVPFQVVLLRFGPMHDVTDKIGWILTYTEWILVNLALLPWARRNPSLVADQVNA